MGERKTYSEGQTVKHKGKLYSLKDKSKQGEPDTNSGGEGWQGLHHYKGEFNAALNHVKGDFASVGKKIYVLTDEAKKSTPGTALGEGWHEITDTLKALKGDFSKDVTYTKGQIVEKEGDLHILLNKDK